MKILRPLIFLILILILVALVSVFSTEAPTSKTINKNPSSQKTDSITIGWVGDMVPTLDQNYNQQVFNQVSSELKKPDLMIGNLEGTFAQKNRLSKCLYLINKCHAFRGDDSFADSLKNAGFDLISLVNNHALDYGDEGLKDTTTQLDRVGIPYISYSQPTISLTIKNKKIGILGLSSTKPAVTIADLQFIQKEVQLLKRKNDFVIVVFHGGAEGTDKTIVPGITEYVGNENRGNVEAVAHLAIDNGADLVLGSGPHVLRKIEIYKKSPIAYSLGNFVGGKERLLTAGTLGISGIFSATLDQNKSYSYNFLSISLSKDGVPTLDSTDQGALLIDKLSQ